MNLTTYPKGSTRDTDAIARRVNAAVRADLMAQEARARYAAPPDPIDALERRCERLEAAVASLAHRIEISERAEAA